MSRGKHYTPEELMLFHALKRFKEANNTSAATVNQILISLTSRPASGVTNMLSRISPPKEGWLVVDLILDDPEPELPPAPKTLADYLGHEVLVKCYSITAYGAFCHIIGTDVQALLHVSKVSEEYVSDISDYVKIGQEFPALVIKSQVPGKYALDIRNITI